MRPHAREADLESHGALAAGLEDRAGRFAEDGDVAGQQIRALVEQLAEAVVLRRDLLGRVEDVGDVDGGLGHGAGQLEHDGEPALHVRGPEAPQRVALDAGAVVAVDRDRVRVAGEHEAHAATEMGAGHEVVADAVELERRHRQQFLLEPVGDDLLVLAD